MNELFQNLPETLSLPFLPAIIGAALGCLFISVIFYIFGARKAKAAEIAHATANTELLIANKHLENLKDESRERDDQIRELAQAKASLETSLKHERDTLGQMRNEMNEHFKVLSQDILDKNSERFLQQAQEKLKSLQKDGAHDLEKRQKAIETMVGPVNESLKTMENRLIELDKSTQSTRSELGTHIKTLQNQSTRLAEALGNPAQRGQWGEMQLQRTLEMVGMVEGTHFIKQAHATTDGIKRPDYIINMPNGLNIIVDVKTPIDPYWDAMETNNGKMEGQNLNHFIGKIRDHVKQLGSKEYWRSFEAAEFVVMYLPTEGLYNLAVSNDKKLLEDAARQNVILASPTTAMGLLRVAMHGWKQHAMTENAREIAKIGEELYQRLNIFTGHMSKIGNGLSTAVGRYNDAVGSLEGRVLPQARKFEEMHAMQKGKEIPQMKDVDLTPRSLTFVETDAISSETVLIEEKKKA